MKLPQAIICNSPHRLTEARALAQKFQLPLLDHEQGLSFSGCCLSLGEQLELQDTTLGNPVFVSFDGTDMIRRLNAGRKQPLARACGLHKERDLHVLDCTAGLGKDMLTIAAQGAKVTPLERNEIIYLLLQDGFTRSAKATVAREALQRCELPKNADAHQWLENCDACFDVIYMDPMFSGYKRRALPKKSMQLLAEICGEDNDASKLFDLALKKARRRVVVKRSPQAPLLSEYPPDHQLKGNRMRYDIYFTA